MSDGLNRVILCGNLGSTPELRYTQGGTAVLSLRLATNETYQDRNKETQERTEWHTVVVWGTRAEGLSKFLAKGMGVVIEGAIRTSSFEKDGVKRYKTEVHARDVLVMPARKGAGGAIPEEERTLRMDTAQGVLPPPKGEPIEELPY